MAGFAVLTLLVTGCGDSEGGASPADTTIVDEVVAVRVLDNTYRPGRLDVAAGTTVEWTNGAATAPAAPATNVPFAVDVDAISVPERPAGA